MLTEPLTEKYPISLEPVSEGHREAVWILSCLSSSSSSYLPDHTEHKNGHVRGLGCCPLPSSCWQVEDHGGRPSAGLQGADKPPAIERRSPVVPSHSMAEVRPNCLLTGHRCASVSSSGKDSALLPADWKPHGGVSSRALCLVPRVSLWCACGPLSDRPFPSCQYYNLFCVRNWFYK